MILPKKGGSLVMLFDTINKNEGVFILCHLKIIVQSQKNYQFTL